MSHTYCSQLKSPQGAMQYHPNSLQPGCLSMTWTRLRRGYKLHSVSWSFRRPFHRYNKFPYTSYHLTKITPHKSVGMALNMTHRCTEQKSTIIYYKPRKASSLHHSTLRKFACSAICFARFVLFDHATSCTTMKHL